MKVDVNEANSQPGDTEIQKSGAVNETKSSDEVFAELAALLQPHTTFSVGPDNVVEAVKQLVGQLSSKLEKGNIAEAFLAGKKNIHDQSCVHLHIRPDDDCWHEVVQAVAKKSKQNHDENAVDKSTPQTDTINTNKDVLNPVECGNSLSVSSNSTNSHRANSTQDPSPKVALELSTAGSRVFSARWRESWKVGLFMDRSPHAKLAGTITRANWTVAKDTYDVKLDNGDEVHDVASPWLSTLK